MVLFPAEIPVLDEQSVATGDQQVADHLTLAEASDLLDWLEVHGIQARDVQFDREGFVSVRWLFTS